MQPRHWSCVNPSSHRNMGHEMQKSPLALSPPPHHPYSLNIFTALDCPSLSRFAETPQGVRNTHQASRSLAEKLKSSENKAKATLPIMSTSWHIVEMKLLEFSVVNWNAGAAQWKDCCCPFLFTVLVQDSTEVEEQDAEGNLTLRWVCRALSLLICKTKLSETAKISFSHF